MSKGYSAPTAREIKNEFESTLNGELDQDLDFGRDTVEGQLSALVSEIVGDLAEQAQALYDQRRIQNATGIDLDDLVKIAGVTRNEATASTVDLTPDGTSGTAIPTGTEVKGPEGYTWESIEDGEIGSGNILFEAQTKGPLDAAANSSWDIITPVNVLDSFSNSSAATPGRARESDQNLISRRNDEFAGGTERQIGSIRSALNDLDFVDAVIAVENRDGSPQTVEGISLAAHSLGVVIYPSTLTSTQETTLAETIYEFGPEGIDTEGSQSETVTAVDNSDVTINWDYASTKTVNATFNPTIDPSTAASEVKAQIEDRANDYFDQLDVGENVRYDALIGYVADIEDFDKVVDLDLTLDSGTSNVTITATEVATVNLTVN